MLVVRRLEARLVHSQDTTVPVARHGGQCQFMSPHGHLGVN